MARTREREQPHLRSLPLIPLKPKLAKHKYLRRETSCQLAKSEGGIHKSVRARP
jgi:hypothetical protein